MPKTKRKRPGPAKKTICDRCSGGQPSGPVTVYKGKAPCDRNPLPGAPNARECQRQKLTGSLTAVGINRKPVLW